MKFVLALAVQALLGLFLVVGILQAVHGSYWLLAAGTVVYLIIFTRAGCTQH